MTSVPHLLLETLKNLKSEKLKEFKWYLQKEGIASAADLEKADAIDTVDLMEAFCRPEGAVEVTLEILRKMKENNLAEQLKNKQKGITTAASHSANSQCTNSVQDLNTQPLNYQHRMTVTAVIALVSFTRVESLCTKAFYIYCTCYRGLKLKTFVKQYLT